ncbi:MAG: glycosyltransferase [Deltaproteobacteria bacterium]|nr:glycosyltransferase [Deltaproteobacteria bacterium]
MKLVIFGLTISSSWGNGHATIWRGLCRAFVNRGHNIVFFEKDVPYYAAHRDLTEMRGVELVLYKDWNDASGKAELHLADADAGLITSYCPDGIEATRLMLSSRARLKAFYDLDTPVTLKLLRAGEKLTYITENGLTDFDLVLSYTGGAILTQLKEMLGAKEALPLYGSVDPDAHRPVAPIDAYRGDLSYLGTYAQDRQEKLKELFIEPSRRLADRRFMLGGSLYPQTFPWTESIFYFNHVPPPEHPSFYCSSLFTLNVTRGAMAEMGYCPSGRLFEAAACGTPILSDFWEGLDNFFRPGSEIIIVRTSDDVVNALGMTEAERRRLSRAARERALEEHSSEKRAIELENILERAAGVKT